MSEHVRLSKLYVRSLSLYIRSTRRPDRHRSQTKRSSRKARRSPRGLRNLNQNTVDYSQTCPAHSYNMSKHVKIIKLYVCSLQHYERSIRRRAITASRAFGGYGVYGICVTHGGVRGSRGEMLEHA